MREAEEAALVAVAEEVAVVSEETAAAEAASAAEEAEVASAVAVAASSRDPPLTLSPLPTSRTTAKEKLLGSSRESAFPFWPV